MMSMQQRRFHEETVTFQGPAGRLAGTLAVPEAPARGAVLIIPGSGAQDRDGNGGKLSTNLYRDLAQAVSGLGFVSLRYDKRGVGKSDRSKSAIGLWDFVADAAAAVDFLRQRSEPDPTPVILLGHSEGCIIGPAVNARLPVAGLILLSGPRESLSATLARQQEQAARDLGSLPGVMGALARTLHLPAVQRRSSGKLTARVMASDRPWIRVGLAKLNAKWIREHYQYDVTRDLAKVQCPSLAITGEHDFQVLPDDARRIAETVAGPAEYHIIPDMTHILRRTTRTQNTLTLLRLYKQLCQEPIDAELLAFLSGWLDGHFPAVSA